MYVQLAAHAMDTCGTYQWYHCYTFVLQPSQTAPATDLYGASIVQLFQDRQLGHLLPVFQAAGMDKAAVLSGTEQQLTNIAQGQMTPRDWIMLNQLQRELAQPPLQQTVMSNTIMH